MQPDDAFRSRLDALIAALRSWAGELAEVADCEETDAADYWRLAVAPHDASACPVELILHRRQRYDVSIGDETYEDLPLERFDLLLPMLQAIAEGRVVTRAWHAAATEALHSVETIVDLPGGTLTGEREVDGVARIVSRDRCIACDRHYAPFALGSAPTRTAA